MFSKGIERDQWQEGEQIVIDYMRCFARFSNIVQFKKREKRPWMSVTFSKYAGFSQY